MYKIGINHAYTKLWLLIQIVQQKVNALCYTKLKDCDTVEKTYFNYSSKV